MESKAIKNKMPINNNGAEILINAYKNNEIIVDQFNARVRSIENGVCEVTFNKGEIRYYSNSLFNKKIIN